MRGLFLLLAVFYFGAASAQVIERFSDGDFTQNPIWFGSGSQWAVDSFRLRSSATGPNQRFSISTFSSPDTTLQLTMDISLGFNPSSQNYVDVFVMSTDTNLLSTTSVGYFIRMGGSDDEIAFYRKDGPTNTKLIDGMNGSLNQSDNRIQLELQKKPWGQWVLSRRINEGPPIEEGWVFDDTYRSGTAFGFVVQQSTSSFFQRHYFDNIELGHYVPDTTSPLVDSVRVLSDQQVLIRFSESMDTAGLFDPQHYVVRNMGTPTYVESVSTQQQSVRLTFPNPIPVRQRLVLLLSGLSDRMGNPIRADTVLFVYYVPRRYDVLITEIMADPEPVQALPSVEWIELRNNTPYPIPLSQWSVTHSGGQRAYLPSIILMPDSLLIITSTSGATAMHSFQNVVAVSSFPTLYNEADLLVLSANNQQIIHAIQYDQSWHTNILKQAGGWSLEMIDYNKPCSQAGNWASSASDLGGTPGKNNSIDAVLPDESPPYINRIYATDSMHVVLQFNEPMDSATIAHPGYYLIDHGLNHPAAISLLPPLFNKAVVRLASPLLHEKAYSIQIRDVADCAGNPMPLSEHIVGLTEPVLPGDLVINEVLFNPISGANDYVELFNRSKKAINLADLLLANRNSLQQPDNYAVVCRENQVCMPGDYWVLTEDSVALLSSQPEANPRRLLTVKSMPSFNDDKGVVLVLDKQGRTIDELRYSDEWHHPDLFTTEGVSLERISTSLPTADSTNWHSASSSSGYGTPTQKNSQSPALIDFGSALIRVFPASVTPNNDGIDDVLQIKYSQLPIGTRSRVVLFDLQGRERAVIKNWFLCGTEDHLFWNGRDAVGQTLPEGFYIVFVECQTPSGKNVRKKTAVFIANG
jgi:hypothetical protein